MRHSFIRMSKLTDVRGRIDYISNPKRQEHLYASYSTADTELWKKLSDQAQFDFWRSHQSEGKCIEARELIIALPEGLQKQEPNALLQHFTESFHKQYGVQCTAALHHNKTMTNCHIHLVFADRDLLDKTGVKIASRNMFYDEEGRRMRTKKEILDEYGNVRLGCRILPKGEIYEIKCFSARKDIFKSRAFLADIKHTFTSLINQLVTEEEKQQVFDPAGPYLPTKKIGKNNPLADQIASDNKLRQEWNRTVDQVLIAGGSQKEVTEFKTNEVTSKVSESIRENGIDPSLFSRVLRFAIDVLKEFLDILMTKNSVVQHNPQADTDQKLDTEKKNVKTRVSDEIYEKIVSEYRRVERIHQKLEKCNRTLYGLQKHHKSVSETLASLPKTIFHRKERKLLEQEKTNIEKQIDQVRRRIEIIPKEYGFDSVKSIEAAYRIRKREFESMKAERESGRVTGVEREGNSKEEKPSILKQLAESLMEKQMQEMKPLIKGKDKKRNMEIEI